jgi:hypothetical protein
VKAIRISPDPAEPIEIIEVEGQWQSLALAIGGPCHYIERFRCPLTPQHNLVGVLDEDGQYNGQRLNQRAWPLYPVPGYTLRGTVLVLAEGMTPEGIEFVDMPDPEAARSIVVSLLEGVQV